MLKFININVLDKNDQEFLKNVADHEYEKLHSLKKGDIVINVKEYKKEGKRKKYSLHARVEAPNVVFNAQADDWDIKLTIHKLFDKLNHGLIHKFKEK